MTKAPTIKAAAMSRIGLVRVVPARMTASRSRTPQDRPHRRLERHFDDLHIRTVLPTDPLHGGTDALGNVVALRLPRLFGHEVDLDIAFIRLVA
ncbi:MAG: hypothetical protein OJF47_003400 [Nitrospira sp.]|nr:MAG: hypothetical protein OJF47_003400 [Nitrospira sp.]